MQWSGTLYNSGAITANGDSGWLPWPTLGGILAGLIRIVPANLATDETLDLVLSVAWDVNGLGSFTLHTFAQITNTNVAASVVFPGNESGALAVAEKSAVIPLPPYFKLTWTLAGTTKSMDFKALASLASAA